MRLWLQSTWQQPVCGHILTARSGRLRNKSEIDRLNHMSEVGYVRNNSKNERNGMMVPCAGVGLEDSAPFCFEPTVS